MLSVMTMNVVMMNVVMLSAIMLSIVAPPYNYACRILSDQHLSIQLIWLVINMLNGLTHVI